MRNTMLWIPAALLMGLSACHSGNGGNSGDTTAMKDTTMKDTSHNMASMSSGMEMPACPPGAKVFFKNLKNGQTVHDPFKVEMGADGISIDSAGAVKPNSGHFHILVDQGDSLAMGIVIPKDSVHLHYGDAQKVATLNLSPGEHTLCLQFADGAHRSYGAQLAAVVKIKVKK